MTHRAPLLSEPETQLLRATGQLQDAIRRRRNSYTSASDYDGESGSEKENCTHAGNDGRCQQRRHNDCDAHSSRGIRMSEWERRGLLRMSELSLTRRSESDDSVLLRSGCSDTSAGVDASIGELTRRALDWMQRNTEQLARETRALQELLLGVIATINDVFIEQLQNMACDGVAGYSLIDEAQHWKELSGEKVAKLADEWEEVLFDWRMHTLDVESEAREREMLALEECDAKVQQLRDTHAMERGKLTQEIGRLAAASSMQQSEYDRVRWRMSSDLLLILAVCTSVVICEDYASALQRSTNRLQCDPQPISESRSLKELAYEGKSMNLKAQLKGAELCCLHWQMAYEDQLERSRQTEERLGMLLEESASAREELKKLQSKLSKTIHVDALKVYQQKIAILEDQVHDMKQQILCDHEQFEYEQKKWELEKKHLGKDIEEIQDVSVKVLKVVLIREKLLKKQERHLKKRVLAAEDRRLHAAEQCGVLQMITRKLMQECAFFLAALQEQTISSAQMQNNVVPVKPIQIKKMLKRLRRLQHELEPEGNNRGADLETASVPVSEECSSGDETALWHASSSDL